MKMVKEDAYDILVQRFQPDAFARETLPAGETLTNPDGYRILKKAGSKLYRVYDDKGELIGTTSTETAAMRKSQDDFAKKASQEERQTRFQPDPLSPNIQVGSNGARIIKSPSGKFRVYSVTGTLLGIRETEQAAKKLATK